LKGLTSSPVTVSLHGEQLIDLQPIKPVQRGTVLNKAGRLVLRGRWQGRPIKLYEAASVEHARFIQGVSGHSFLADCFPRVQALHGCFLRVDWVEGKATHFPPPKIFADLLRRMHTVSIAEFSSAGFDYWHHHLKPRFVRAAQLFGIDELAARTNAEVDTYWSNEPQVLMHPDITPSNVVLNAQGVWQVIDNELLTVGGLPLLDLCNTAYAAGTQAGQLVTNLYLAQAGWRPTDQQVKVLNAAWFARVIGSSFVDGRLETIHSLTDRYRNGEIILPIQFKAAD
jgi:hypothetical protein